MLSVEILCSTPRGLAPRRRVLRIPSSITRRRCFAKPRNISTHGNSVKLELMKDQIRDAVRLADRTCRFAFYGKTGEKKTGASAGIWAADLPRLPRVSGSTKIQLSLDVTQSR